MDFQELQLLSIWAAPSAISLWGDWWGRGAEVLGPQVCIGSFGWQFKAARMVKTGSKELR
jgi:hypothetical protein